MAVAQRMSWKSNTSGLCWRCQTGNGSYRRALRIKPGVTWEHADIAMELAYLLRHQIPRDEYWVFIESRVRRPHGHVIFMPDVMVAPTAYSEPFRGRPARWRPSSIHCRSSSRSGHRRRASTTSTPSCLYINSVVDLTQRIHPYERTPPRLAAATRRELRADHSPRGIVTLL